MYAIPPLSIGLIRTVNLSVTLRMYDVGSSITDAIGASVTAPSQQAQGRWGARNNIRGTDRAARGARREIASQVISFIIQ